jgi:hypothetical protein
MAQASKMKLLGNGGPCDSGAVQPLLTSFGGYVDRADRAENIALLDSIHHRPGDSEQALQSFLEHHERFGPQIFLHSRWSQSWSVPEEGEYTCHALFQRLSHS